MTECGDALLALKKLYNQESVKLSSSDLHELLALKLVTTVKSPGVTPATEEDIRTLKSNLQDINKEKEQTNQKLSAIERQNIKIAPKKLLKTNMGYKNLKERLTELESQERGLRTRLVNLVQNVSSKTHYAKANDRYVTITYRGRELISELEQRKARVHNSELSVFLKELDGIKTHFKRYSEKAHKILKKISPEFPKVEEIHLRSAAVGLAGRQGSADEAADLFIHAFKKISGSIRWIHSISVALSESLCIIAKDKQDLEGLISKALDLSVRPWVPGGVKEDQVRAVSIILSQRDKMDRVLNETKRLVDSTCSGWFSAAAFLAIQSLTRKGKSSWIRYSSGEPLEEKYDIVQKFEYIKKEIFKIGDVWGESVMAAALLSAANLPVEIILDRYQSSKIMLQKFNLGEMILPSAMVAILPADVDETMDNLRLASGAIGGNRLSLGGVENLSLGLKLLSHSSVMPADIFSIDSPGVPVGTAPVAAPTSALSVTGISLATGISLSAGVIAFHEVSIHRTAERDFEFHPVHSHYIYG